MKPLPYLTIATTIILSTLLIFHVLTAPTSAQSNGCNFFVATNGNDFADGKEASPWKTIQHAANTLTAGQTVCIKEGTYAEAITSKNSGTKVSPIAFERYGTDVVKITGKPGVEPIWNIVGKNYNIVDGFRFEYPHATEILGFNWNMIEMKEGASNNIIRNCTIIREGNPSTFFTHTANGDGSSRYKDVGISVSGSSTLNNLVKNNIIRGMKIGISIKEEPRGTIIRGNHIVDTIFHGISGNGRTGKIQGILIEDNVIERTWIEDGVQFVECKNNCPISEEECPQNCATSAYDTRGVIIRNNIFRDCVENAMDLKDTSNFVIEGNVIYRTVGSSMFLDSGNSGDQDNLSNIVSGYKATLLKDAIIRRNIIFDSSSGIRLYKGSKVYNNTFVGNNYDYTGHDSTPPSGLNNPLFVSGRRQGSDATGIAYVNNIAVNHNSAEISLTFDANYPNQYFDYNLYYNDQNLRFAKVVDGQNWTPLSFELWQQELSKMSGISGNEQHSIAGKSPLFTDANMRPNSSQQIEKTMETSKMDSVKDLKKHFDFSLQNNSPAREAGGPLTRVSSSDSGTGLKLKVDDAGFFMDGFGVTRGDKIMIGEGSRDINTDSIRIAKVNYSTNELTLEKSVTRKRGDPVFMAYHLDAPDIGAIEMTTMQIPDGLWTEGVPGDVGMGSGSGGDQAYFDSTSLEPGCGDGSLDSDEACETGDPSDSTCQWNSDECDQETCACSEEPPPQKMGIR